MTRQVITCYALFVVGCLMVSVTPTRAQCGDDQLFSPGSVVSYGQAVAASNDVLVVGAPADDNGNGARAGAAYIFRRTGTGWIEEAKLLALDGATQDQFGISVAIDGDLVVVGAQSHDANGLDAGAIYLFRNNGTNWIQEAKLLASNGVASDLFGGLIDVSGNVVIVGTSRRGELGVNSGAAYIYAYDGADWSEEAILHASDGEAWDRFGGSVALKGDVAFIGAYGDDDNGLDAGAAYVFVYDGLNWNERDKLFPNDGGPGMGFGRRLSAETDRVLVFGGGVESGYIFGFDGLDWIQETKLIPPADSNLFGTIFSADLKGDTVAVGSFLGDLVYVFRRDVDEWPHLETFTVTWINPGWLLAVALDD
ncbi:MAG: FG-GAP repeat protein, partial [Planctomycetota bacterium]|nr:FG-GAP repeat protein [Planctomycetota bacterium]